VQAFIALHLPAPVFLGPHATLWSIANISTWEFAGYNMIIFYSAMQSIPQEIYESGRLDGLSETGIALRLKLPLIVPALILGLLFSIVGSLQLFNEPTVLKNLTNSAITTSYTPNIFAYNVAVVNTDFNYGGAIAVILGVVTFIFSYGFLRITRGRLGV
jgi:multiple sugar transport system permease protein